MSIMGYPQTKQSHFDHKKERDKESKTYSLHRRSEPNTIQKYRNSASQENNFESCLIHIADNPPHITHIRKNHLNSLLTKFYQKRRIQNTEQSQTTPSSINVPNPQHTHINHSPYPINPLKKHQTQSPSPKIQHARMESTHGNILENKNQHFLRENVKEEYQQESPPSFKKMSEQHFYQQTFMPQLKIEYHENSSNKKKQKKKRNSEKKPNPNDPLEQSQNHQEIQNTVQNYHNNHEENHFKTQIFQQPEHPTQQKNPPQQESQYFQCIIPQSYPVIKQEYQNEEADYQSNYSTATITQNSHQATIFNKMVQNNIEQPYEYKYFSVKHEEPEIEAQPEPEQIPSPEKELEPQPQPQPEPEKQKEQPFIEDFKEQIPETEQIFNSQKPQSQYAMLSQNIFTAILEDPSDSEEEEEQKSEKSQDSQESSEDSEDDLDFLKKLAQDVKMKLLMPQPQQESTTLQILMISQTEQISPPVCLKPVEENIPPTKPTKLSIQNIIDRFTPKIEPQPIAKPTKRSKKSQKSQVEQQKPEKEPTEIKEPEKPPNKRTKRPNPRSKKQSSEENVNGQTKNILPNSTSTEVNATNEKQTQTTQSNTRRSAPRRSARVPKVNPKKNQDEDQQFFNEEIEEETQKNNKSSKDKKQSSSINQQGTAISSQLSAITQQQPQSPVQKQPRNPRRQKSGTTPNQQIEIENEKQLIIPPIIQVLSQEVLKEIQNDLDESNEEDDIQATLAEIRKLKGDWKSNQKKPRRTLIKGANTEPIDPFMCTVCLDNPTSDFFGEIDCRHRFCFPCISDWAKVTNQCPMCRQEFSRITKRNFDGSLSKKNSYVLVRRKKQRIKEDDYLEEAEILQEEEDRLAEQEEENSWICYKCLKSDRDHLLLVCDVCDDNYCHTFCDEKLSNRSRVPSGRWSCHFCRM